MNEPSPLAMTLAPLEGETTVQSAVTALLRQVRAIADRLFDERPDAKAVLTVCDAPDGLTPTTGVVNVRVQARAFKSLEEANAYLAEVGVHPSMRLWARCEEPMDHFHVTVTE
ncbi:MAG TPA: hypothetical protein VGI39_39165 [Polyangiaceae bacterium]|jgi:hypothetical protein